MIKHQKIKQLIKQVSKNRQIPVHYWQTHYSRLGLLTGKLISWNLSGKRVLDIGCYPPVLFLVAQKLGANVWGITGRHEKMEGKQIIIVDLNQAKLPFAKNDFDLVIFCEVLEHLDCPPVLIFKEIKRVLKDKGACLITTPNATSGINRLKLLAGLNIFTKMESILDKGPLASFHWHHREYTLNELKQITHQAGLKVKKAGWLTVYGPFRPLKKPIVVKIGYWFNWLMGKIIPPLGDTLYLELIKQ